MQWLADPPDWQGMKAMFSRTHGNALHACLSLFAKRSVAQTGWTAHPAARSAHCAGSATFCRQSHHLRSGPWTPWTTCSCIWSVDSPPSCFLPLKHRVPKGQRDCKFGWWMHFPWVGLICLFQLIPTYSSFIIFYLYIYNFNVFISKTDLFMHSLLRIPGPNMQCLGWQNPINVCIPVSILPRIWWDKWSALQLFIFTPDCRGCCSIVLFTTACQILKVWMRSICLVARCSAW